MPSPINRNTRSFRTSGTQDTSGHNFYNNNFVVQFSPDNISGEYPLPKLSASTGTDLYYNQNIRSIFIIYTRPFISMTFTANNQSFSASNFIEMFHDIYKIPFNEMNRYNADPTSIDNWETVKEKIDNPLISYSIPTSSTITYTSTTEVYDFYPEQLGKRKENFTEEIFEDRSQYFFNTRFEFWNTFSAYTDTVVLDDTVGTIVNYPYSSETIITSNGNLDTITQGPWSGVSDSKGLFFTCFHPPSKPVVEFPFPPTSTTMLFSTFTPTFNFSNVEDGDEYVLQVTYAMNDSTFLVSTGTSGYTSYVRQKEDDTLEQIVDKDTSTSTNIDETTTTRRTRRINAALRPGAEFWFRIGNVKGLLNIFGIKQTVITYSESYSGVTPNAAYLDLIIDSKSVSGAQSEGSSSGQQGVPIVPPDTIEK